MRSHERRSAAMDYWEEMVLVAEAVAYRGRDPVFSVSRFVKISALWPNFDCSFFIWQNVEPTLANLLHFWAHFHCYKRSNNGKII